MSHYVREYLKIKLIDVNSSGYRMEARVGIEPTNKGFADPLRSLLDPSHVVTTIPIALARSVGSGYHCSGPGACRSAGFAMR